MADSRPHGGIGLHLVGNTFYADYFQCAYIAIYQWKVDEEKLIPFVAGGCMWLCW